MTALFMAMSLATVAGCGSASDRANDELTGSVVLGAHMAELNRDFTKVYLTSSDKNEVVVVDTRTLGADTSREALLNRAYVVCRDSGDLAVIDLRTMELVSQGTDYRIQERIAVGAHPTHLSTSRDGRFLAVMAEEEGDGAVSFVDMASDREVKRLAGFYTPHFMRFSQDGRYGYVANIGAHHLTRVDLESLEIDSHIPLDGYDGPPNVTRAPDESGFGDAQIDASGVLYAAHSATGRVLVYDSIAERKLPELLVGYKPWIAFAEHPFTDLPLRHLVTNFGDQSVDLIQGGPNAAVVASLPGDAEAYGVNFSSRTPNKAFVMNRIRQDVAVIDTEQGTVLDRIKVGGNTETAATTADGKYIVAAVSGANKVVVIDAETNAIVRTFENIGKYPWSVTIPFGQNYCH
jgi:YVTN family beta-propeller protein